jgi:hypothetical protein
MSAQSAITGRFSIERLPLPVRTEWERQYAFNPGIPIIFTGIVEHWPAFRRWSFEWFARNYSDVRAPVREYGADGKPHEIVKSLGEFSKITLA